MAAMALAVGVVGALRRRVIVALGVRLGQRVADMAGHRAPRAVIAAVLDPSAQLLDRGLPRVERHRRGLRDGDWQRRRARRGRPPSTCSTTAFSDA